MSSLNCKAANLTSVPVITEGRGITVQGLILDGNNLSMLLDYEFTNAGFNNLVKLSLRNCNMKILSEKLFYNLTNLQDLNLSGNLLSQLPPNQFALLPQLRILDLSHNTLSYMHSSTLTSLSSSLSHLYLAGNILTSLPDSSFSLLSTLTTLKMSANPWTCDCLLAGLHARLVQTNSIPTKTTCSRPLALLDQSWAELVTSDFGCRPVVSAQELVTSWPGHTASLQCNVTASPGTEVLWLDGARVLHNNAHPGQDRDPHLYQQYGIKLDQHMPGEYSTTYISVLSIKNISMTSAGFYTCLAWNKVGMDQKHISLNLEDTVELVVDDMEATVIIGVAAFVIIIVIIIIFLCYLRSGKGHLRKSGVYFVSSSRSKVKVNLKHRSSKTGSHGRVTQEDGPGTLSRHSTDQPGTLSRNSTDQTIILAEGGDGQSDIVVHSDSDPGNAGTVAPLVRASSDQPAIMGVMTTSWPQAQCLDYLDRYSSQVSHLPRSRASLGTVPSTDQTYTYFNPVHHHHGSAYATLPRRYSCGHSVPASVQSAHSIPWLPNCSHPQQVTPCKKQQQQLGTISELEL